METETNRDKPTAKKRLMGALLLIIGLAALWTQATFSTYEARLPRKTFAVPTHRMQMLQEQSELRTQMLREQSEFRAQALQERTDLLTRRTQAIQTAISELPELPELPALPQPPEPVAPTSHRIPIAPFNFIAVGMMLVGVYLVVNRFRGEATVTQKTGPEADRPFV